MKKISVYLVSILFLFQASLLAYNSEPKEFVVELVNDAISNLSNKNLNKGEKKKLFKKSH